MKDQSKAPWVKWESTDEYNTEVDGVVKNLCKRLQARVMQLQDLELAQLLGPVIAEVVSQVVPPAAGAPTPAGVEVMDMTAAGPGSMMGPDTPVQSEEMPWVLNPDEEARKQRWLEQQFHHPTDSVILKILMTHRKNDSSPV